MNDSNACSTTKGPDAGRAQILEVSAGPRLVPESALIPSRNLHKRRADKERALLSLITPRRCGERLLSDNSKSGPTLDSPVLYCQHTQACSCSCYACQGRQMYPASLRKTLAVDAFILADPDLAARCVESELADRWLRLAGGGELTEDHEPFIAKLAELGVKAYAFTRRPDSWLMYRRHGFFATFSLDGTTPETVLRWVLRVVPVRARAFMATPEYPTTRHRVAVIFPEHGSITRGARHVPESPLDCPSARAKLDTLGGAPCHTCRRCYGEDAA